MNKLSIIIPCYNEAKNIQECIRRIPQMDWETEIIVVDDGSLDKTAEEAKKINRPKVKVIRYEKNKGKGCAFRTGLKEATGDVVIILDADYTCPPEEIPSVVRPIFSEEADFVNTSRFIYPREKGAMRWLHIPGNKIFALLLSLIIKQRITDSLSGFKAFRKDKLSAKLKENNWPDLELLIKAKRNNLKIIEVPIHYKARRAGLSKMKTFKSIFLMSAILARSLKD